MHVMSKFIRMISFVSGPMPGGEGNEIVSISYILSQWAWFSMSTRNFICSVQNSARPLRIQRRCTRVSRDETPRDYFGFLD